MSVSIVALPHGLNPAMAHDLAFDCDGLTSRDISCVPGLPDGPEQVASLTPYRLLARLFQSGSKNAADAARKRAIAEAETLVLLAGVGQFDDDVWTPIIARLLGARDKDSNVTAPVFAWTGLEPLLLPYESRGNEVAANPRLAAELLPPLERAAPALAHLLRASRERDDAMYAQQMRIAALSLHRKDPVNPVLGIAFR
jgi:hypothetical protein